MRWQRSFRPRWGSRSYLIWRELRLMAAGRGWLKQSAVPRCLLPVIECHTNPASPQSFHHFGISPIINATRFKEANQTRHPKCSSPVQGPSYSCRRRDVPIEPCVSVNEGMQGCLHFRQRSTDRIGQIVKTCRSLTSRGCRLAGSFLVTGPSCPPRMTSFPDIASPDVLQTSSHGSFPGIKGD